MAKTIKFNLICDEYPVRTIEDLKEHFCIQDILEYYKKGLLTRWLTVRGYEKELEKVEAIEEKENVSIIKKLVEIFEIETEEQIINENIYILEYQEQQKIFLDEYDRKKLDAKMLLNAHYASYKTLIQKIVENPEDLSLIKASIKEIVERYMDIFEKDYRTLFKIFYECAPMAIFVMLMHDEMRSKYLKLQTSNDADACADENLKEKNNSGKAIIIDVLRQIEDLREREEKQIEEISSENKEQESLIDATTELLEKRITELKAFIEKDKDELYLKIKLLANATKLKEIFKDNIKCFAGKTDDYWKDLETNEKKYMILSMEKGNLIRSANNRDEEFTIDDVYDLFPILKGIDYKSKDETHELLYVEV